uniref:Uncharacterized protein n=1 Tax=Xiphophorus couchianus TaxID=32473 RepID=A0A3B5LDB0_9TELE
MTSAFPSPHFGTLQLNIHLNKRAKMHVCVSFNLCSTAARFPWRTSSRCPSASLQIRCSGCRPAASPATDTPPCGCPGETRLMK